MTPTFKYTCPFCEKEQIPALSNEGNMMVGSLLLCDCEQSLKEEERKHREQMEIRLRNRQPIVKRRR